MSDAPKSIYPGSETAPKWLKEAFYETSVPKKNIALRKAYDEIVRLRSVAQRPADRGEDFEEALQRIVQWSEAYPLDIFPIPDLKQAAELLKAGGITLDAVSAHCMRHVVEGVGKIARDALAVSSTTFGGAAK